MRHPIVTKVTSLFLSLATIFSSTSASVYAFLPSNETANVVNNQVLPDEEYITDEELYFEEYENLEAFLFGSITQKELKDKEQTKGKLESYTSLESLTMYSLQDNKDKEYKPLGYFFGASTVGGNISYVPSTLNELVISNGEINKNSLRGIDTLKKLTLPQLPEGGFLSAAFGAEDYSENIVPDSIKEVTVINGEILKNAFYGCSDIETITLGDGVTYIEAGAFDGCVGLKKIVLSENITEISQSAFEGLSALETVEIKGKEVKIRPRAFYGCTNLRKISFDNISYIGNHAFFGCENLGEITLGDNIKEIQKYAFSECFGVTIKCNKAASKKWYENWHDESVEVKYNDASESYQGSLFGFFENDNFIYTETEQGLAVSLKKDIQYSGEITVPANYDNKIVTEIGYRAFADRSGIKKINFSKDNNIKTIGASAFEGTGISVITLPDGIKTIGDNAFMNCVSLSKITIPASVTSIGNKAFYGCTALETVIFENTGVLNIEADAFLGCNNVVNVENTSLDSWLNITFENEYSNPIFYSRGLYIGVGDNKNELTRCVFNENGKVNAYAFYNCLSLESIDLNGVNNIGNNAFAGCENLKVLINAPIDITYEASENCGYISKYPDVIKYVDNTVKISDADQGQEVFVDGDGFVYKTASPDETTLFAYIGDEKEITLPQAVKYEKLLLFGVTKITVPDGTESLVDEMFKNNPKLETVSIPDSITKIGRRVFENCGNITLEYADCETALRIVKKASDWDYGCNVTKNYAIADSGFYWESDDFNTFKISGAKNEEITIPLHIAGKDVIKIVDYAFKGNETIKTVHFPENIQPGFIGYMIFDGCKNIETIDLGDGSCLNGHDGYYLKTESKEVKIHSSLFGIPKNESALKEYVFSNPSESSDINGIVYSGDKNYSVKDGILYKNVTISIGGEEKTVPVAVIDAPRMIEVNEINLPDTVVKVSPYAFAYNENITSITLPYVRMIGKSAFLNATALETVKFGKEETAGTSGNGFVIEDVLDELTGKLPETTIMEIKSDNTIGESESIEENIAQYIDEQAFMGCTALSSINLESSTIIGIRSKAFSGCTSIESLELGASIEILGKKNNNGALIDEASVFSGMTALKSISVAEGNKIFSAENGVLYRKDDDNPNNKYLILYPSAVEYNEFEITGNISVIKPEAFAGTQYLTNLKINPAETVSCEVGTGAFKNSSIVNLEIGENVGSLSSVSNGEYETFSDCENLASINVNSKNKNYSSGDGVLFNHDKTKLIKYPAQKQSAIYTIPSTVTNIYAKAFSDNINLTYVEICSDIDKIGDYAFYRCSKLEEIFFNGVNAPRSIETYTFVKTPDNGNKTEYMLLSYLDTGDNKKSWEDFKKIYDKVTQREGIPNFSIEQKSENDDYYTIVLIDSDGKIIENECIVSLSGKRPVYLEGSDEQTEQPDSFDNIGETEGLSTEQGIVTFYDLAGNTEEGVGLSLYYDYPYKLTVYDNNGEYYLFENPDFYLDPDTHISYITLSRKPSFAVYDLNGGVSSAVLDYFPVKKGAEYDLPYYDSVTRPGYTLKGWKTEIYGANGEIKEYLYNNNNFAKFKHEGYQPVFVLKAIWEPNESKLELYFNCPSSNCSDIHEDKTILGHTDEIKIIDPLDQYTTHIDPLYHTHKGYTFVGWTKEKDGNVVYTDTFVYGPESSYALYGKWIANTNILIFDPNGGSGTMDDMDIETDEIKQLPENGFKRAGYTFDGWTTTKNKDDSEIILNSASYTGTEDAVQILYAQWTANSSTVKLHENISEDKSKAITKTTDFEQDLRELKNTFTRDGYEIVGWTTTASGGGSYYSSDSTYMFPVESGDLYAVWSKVAEAFGVSADSRDINSQTIELNKAQYGYYDDGKTAETIEVAVIGYVDETKDYEYIGGGLYQNGIKICEHSRIEKTASNSKNAMIYFDLPVKNLQNEVEIEARLELENGNKDKIFCSTALNIHVFDFIITNDDINLNTAGLGIDLSAIGGIAAELFGGKRSIKLGDNTMFDVEINDSEVVLSIDTSDSYSSTSKTTTTTITTNVTDYKAGYFHAEKARAHNKNTYVFSFKNNTQYGMEKYVVRFARDHERKGYYYYSCRIYLNEYQNETARFFGIVSCPEARTLGRAPLAVKAYEIYTQYRDKKQIYIDEIKGINDTTKTTSTSTKTNSLSASLYGEIRLQYSKNEPLKFSGKIDGQLKYVVTYNKQLVVWIIPITMGVELGFDGKLTLNFYVDTNQKISFDASMRLKAYLSGNLGVGCSVASVGISGGVSIVFILDFAPNFGASIELLEANLKAYVKLLWYHKSIDICEGKRENIKLFGDLYDGELQGSLDTATLFGDFDTGVLFDVSTYRAVEPDELSESAKLYKLTNGTIVKIGYINASLRFAGYDNTNFHKIAICSYNSTEEKWNDPILLDDDSKVSDMAFDAVLHGNDKLEVVYTQQAESDSPDGIEDINDTYAIAENVVIKHKTISLDENKLSVSKATVIRSSDAPYAYLPSISIGSDETMTVVWAENTDNNILGVSPHNFTDDTDKSKAYTFTTMANVVKHSTCVSGSKTWIEQPDVYENLSVITALMVDSAGNIAYICDENGDLSDSYDKVLYYNNQAVNDIEQGSVQSLYLYGDNFAYYYESLPDDSEDDTQSDAEILAEEKPTGIYVMNDDNTHISITTLPSSLNVLTDKDNNVKGLIYIQNAPVQNEQSQNELDSAVSFGSGIYGIFHGSDGFGLPVEIIKPENEVYFTSLSAVLDNVNDIRFVYDTNNKESVTEEYTFDNKTLQLEAYSFDKKSSVITMNICNIGSDTAELHVKEEGSNSVVSTDIKIGSGEKTTVEYKLKSSGTKALELYSDICFDEIDNIVYFDKIDNIERQYSDIEVIGKQIIMGKNNALFIVVKNIGNKIAKNIKITAKYDNDKELTSRTLAELAANDVYYFNNIFAEDEGIITITATLENGGDDYLDNNTCYLSFKPLTGTTESLKEYDISELVRTCEIEQTDIEFDPNKEEDIIIPYYTPDDVDVVEVDAGDIAVVDAENNTITLKIEELKEISNNSTSLKVTVRFSDGSQKTITISFPQYYRIAFYDGQNKVSEAYAKEGTLPNIPEEVPQKDSTNKFDYHFKGWMDENGGEIGVKQAEADCTYIAVYSEVEKQFVVTWKLKDKNNKDIILNQNYCYGDMPQYPKAPLVPEGQLFKGWDKDLSQVVADEEYIAEYEKDSNEEETNPDNEPVILNSWTMTCVRDSSNAIEAIKIELKNPVTRDIVAVVQAKDSDERFINAFLKDVKKNSTEILIQIDPDTSNRVESFKIFFLYDLLTLKPFARYMEFDKDTDSSGNIDTTVINAGSRPGFEIIEIIKIPQINILVDENEDAFGHRYNGDTKKLFSLPTLTGYDFCGAYETVSNNKTKEAVGENCIVDADGIIVYKEIISDDFSCVALWKPSVYSLTIKDLNDKRIYYMYNNGFYEDINCTIPVSRLEMLEKAGCIFDGYIIDDASEQAITDKNGFLNENVSVLRPQNIIAKWSPDEYTLAFYANGGRFADNKPEKYISQEGLSGVNGNEISVSRIGYTFDGWYTERYGGEKAFEIDENEVLKDNLGNRCFYAHWIPNKYTVKFVPNGGTFLERSRVVTFDSQYGELPVTERIGYTFNGWYYGDTEITKDTIVFTASDHTLTAKWTPNEYTVTFDPNGGTVSESSKVVTFDSQYGELPTPERTGYAFNGWYHGNTEITKDIIVSIANNHTLTAKWTPNEYTVTFAPNGGTVSPSSKVVTYDSKYDSLPEPQRPGYIFNGWYYGDTKITKDTIVSTASDHTLTAKWAHNSYTVTFDSNGGTVSERSRVVRFDGKYGSLPTPQRTGYTFAGWYYGNKEITEDTIASIASNHTLTAKWEAIPVTVSFSSCETGILQNTDKSAVTSGNNMSIDYNGITKTYTLTPDKSVSQNPSDPYSDISQTVYLQVGVDYRLYLKSTGKVQVFLHLNNYYCPTQPFSNDAGVIDVGFGVEYTGEYNIRFDNDSNDTVTITDFSIGIYDKTANEIEDIVVKYDSKYGELPVPETKGNTFSGWVNSEGYRVDKDSLLKNPENHTLYATWTPNEYTVSFYDNIFWLPIETKKVTYGSKYGSLPEPPQKTGYTFKEWRDNWLLGSEVTEDSIVNKANDHNLFTKWTPNEYTVTFDPNGGTVSESSKVVTFDSKYGSLPTPERTGYAFVGWYYGDTKINKDSIVSLAGNHTLTAKYTKTVGTATAPITDKVDLEKEKEEKYITHYNVGLNKTLLKELGYKTIDLIVTIQVSEAWLTHTARPILHVYIEENSVLKMVDFDYIRKHNTKETKQVTVNVDIDVIDNEGKIKIGLAGRQRGGFFGGDEENDGWTQNGYNLYSVNVTVTAKK